MRPDRMPLPDDPARLTDFKMFCLETDLGTIDLLGDISGVGSFEEVARQSTIMEIGGVSCRVLNIDALIAAKRAAGRAKDRIAVRELEAVRKRLEEGGPGRAT